jgi:hypothetical protein
LQGFKKMKFFLFPEIVMVAPESRIACKSLF